MRFMYRLLALLNDVNAVSKGKAGRRIARRAYGRASGRLARKMLG